MRNVETGVNSPRSSISTPPSLDTVVSLLRTSNVEPLVRDLAKEIEGRFDLLRSQIKEAKDEGRILELLQDQERNILEAVRQVTLFCNFKFCSNLKLFFYHRLNRPSRQFKIIKSR